MEERDDENEEDEEIWPATLTLAIFVALAAIILVLALIAGLAWRLSGR